MRKENVQQKVVLKVNDETVNELKRLQGLKAHSCPDVDSLLMKMCKDVEKVWVPVGSQRKGREGKGLSRYVPVQVRADVWKKGQGRCQNCGSTYGLEIDHIVPFARGGKRKQIICNCYVGDAIRDKDLCCLGLHKSSREFNLPNLKWSLILDCFQNKQCPPSDKSPSSRP